MKPKVYVEPSNFFLFDKFSGFVGQRDRFSNIAGAIATSSTPTGTLAGADITPVNINRPPVANIGTVQTITLPVNSVTLNGSLSSDPDGDHISYFWSQVNGPNQAIISNASNNISVAQNLISGTYTFNLTVTDDKGATGNAQVVVTVNPAPAGNFTLPIWSAIPTILPGTQQTTTTTTTIGHAATTIPANMPNGQPAILGGGMMGGGMMGSGEPDGQPAPGTNESQKNGETSSDANASKRVFGIIDKKTALYGGIGLVAILAIWKRKALIEFIKHL